LERRWESLFEGHKYQELAKDVLDESGVYQAAVLGDDYLRKVTGYWLSCFYCDIRQFDKAQRYVDLFDYWAPIEATYMPPYDIGQGWRLARYRRLSAIEKGLPSALVVSLPKSASAFLSQAVFEVPIRRVSIGDGVRLLVIRRWPIKLLKEAL